MVFQDDRRLPWMMLSDGMRSVIALAMDIAWRAVVLNPQLGAKAPEQATGIVLIDELDLALHPVWQRRIVGDLSRAFPSIQFIATTHSPQIIGSAKRLGPADRRRSGVGGEPSVWARFQHRADGKSWAVRSETGRSWRCLLKSTSL